jgi:hypothetical protein
MIVVTGLPRSGTSLCMQMLEAGGIPVLIDPDIPADDRNPRGYYEIVFFDGWAAAAKGKAVKVVEPFLRLLPPGPYIKILVMRRDVREVSSSRGEPIVQMIRASQRMAKYLAGRDCLDVSHRGLFTDPAPVIASIDRFLGRGLDCQAMARTIDHSLYRHRAG